MAGSKTLENWKFFRQTVCNTLREFCSMTTVHGLRYFTEENLHFIERMWWSVSTIVAVVLCAIATTAMWFAWRERLVIVSFDDRNTPIGAIPFPAVTICSTQSFVDKKLNANDLFERFHSFEYKNDKIVKITSDDVNRLDVLMQMCAQIGINKSGRTAQVRRSEPIYQTIKNLMPDTNITILSAIFQRNNAFFYPIITSKGLCYTFNSLNSKEIYSDEITSDLLTVDQNPSGINWNIEYGYKDHCNTDKVYPIRVYGTKMRDTLVLDVGIIPNKMNIHCVDKTDAIIYALHSPDELPRIPEDFMLVQGYQEFHITVNPNFERTGTALRGYSSQARRCFFKSERKLRFFKTYSEHHCKVECLANYTNHVCDCVPFFMPRDNQTNICTMVDYECYEHADEQFSKALIELNCNCLSDCASLTYSAASSHADIFKPLKQPNQGSNGTNNNLTGLVRSRLLISFKESQFIGRSRSETSTMLAYIANCGGILGLLMGISILSVVELIYYFTLRLFFKLRRERINRITPMPLAQ